MLGSGDHALIERQFEHPHGGQTGCHKRAVMASAEVRGPSNLAGQMGEMGPAASLRLE